MNCIIGTGFKDRFSMDVPKNDAQFASFFLDPSLARVINALTAGTVAIPKPPRNDLLPVVTYAPPIAATGTPAGRLPTCCGSIPESHRPRPAARVGWVCSAAIRPGFPNGRRVFDDVTDIRTPAGCRRRTGPGVPPVSTPPSAGAWAMASMSTTRHYRTRFPYLADSPSGRDRRPYRSR
jgi:hypothetical protein